MPNKHRRKRGIRKYADYTEENLNAALEHVVSGVLSIRAAAEKYSVPKSTVHRKYHGKHPRTYGGQTVFSKKDEEHIVNGLLLASQWGFPLTKLEIRHIGTKSQVIYTFKIGLGLVKRCSFSCIDKNVTFIY